MARPNLNRPVPTGGALPGGGGGQYGPKRSRQINRQRINDRRRRINAALRTKAKTINADRIAAAKAKTAERFKSPDLTSNETYQRNIAGAENRFNQANIGLDDQENQLGINYGLGEKGGSVASNPYSRAALLQRSYDQNQRRTQNSMAAAGQLYSGATQNARNFNSFNYGQAGDALRKDFGSRISQIGVQRQGALDQLGAARESALRDAINTTRKENPVTRDNAPRAVKPKLFKPKFRPLIKPINRPRRGPSGGVRP